MAFKPKSVEFLRIDINEGQVRKSVSVRRSDTTPRTLIFSIVDSGAVVELDDCLFAEFLLKKPDGKEADNGCVINGNAIEYTLKSTDIQVLGTNEAQLALTFKDGTSLTTPVFYIEVYEKVMNPNVQQSTNEYGSIVEQLAEVNRLAELTEGYKEDAIEAKDEAILAAESVATVVEETAAIKAETEIIKEETAVIRDTAETFKTEAAENALMAAASAAAAEASIDDVEAIKTETEAIKNATADIKGAVEEEIKGIDAKISDATEKAVASSTKAAEGFKDEAETARNAAVTAQMASDTARIASETARDAAVNAQAQAERSQTVAEGYKNEAISAAAVAEGYKNEAETARDASEEFKDESEYYYEQAKAISEGLSGSLIPMGTVAFEALPEISSVQPGWMYNISDEFTTTSDFEEGAGDVIPAGSNIYLTANNKWDVLAGSPVTGVKGANNDYYQRGNVSLSAADVGADVEGAAAEALSEAKAYADDITPESLGLATVATTGSYSDLEGAPEIGIATEDVAGLVKPDGETITIDEYGTLHAESTGGDYLDKENPTGTGSLSLNRLEDSTVGEGSVAVGLECVASGDYSHAEGYKTTASGPRAHTEGSTTMATANYTHAEGVRTSATATGSHSEGGVTIAGSSYTHAEGYMTSASGSGSHSEGGSTSARGDYSHAEGAFTTAEAYGSHTEGYYTRASKGYAHAENESTTASGLGAHAQGYKTVAGGNYSHAEGYMTTAIGLRSHAEGNATSVAGQESHVSGYNTKTDQSDALVHGYNLSVSNVYFSPYGSAAFGNNIMSDCSRVKYTDGLSRKFLFGVGSSDAPIEDLETKGLAFGLDVKGGFTNPFLSLIAAKETSSTTKEEYTLDYGATYVLFCNAYTTANAWRGAHAILIAGCHRGCTATASAVAHHVAMGSVGTVGHSVTTSYKGSSGSYQSVYGISACTTAIKLRYALYRVMAADFIF